MQSPFCNGQVRDHATVRETLTGMRIAMSGVVAKRTVPLRAGRSMSWTIEVLPEAGAKKGARTKKTATKPRRAQSSVKKARVPMASRVEPAQSGIGTAGLRPLEKDHAKQVSSARPSGVNQLRQVGVERRAGRAEYPGLLGELDQRIATH